MSVPQQLPNLVKFFTAIRKPQRDYMNFLATVQGLTETQTVYELVTRAVAVFLSRRPWEKDPDFEWVRPESYYLLSGGIRHSNKDWLSFNCKLGDIKSSDGGVIRSKDLVKALDKLAADVVVPWLRGKKLLTHGKGQNATYYTIIVWMLTELYPESVYRRPVATPAMVGLDELNFPLKAGKAKSATHA